jgi:hypothetical protein
MAYKHAALILLLSLLGTSLAATQFGCSNSITPTPRAKSSWVSGGFGYQVYDLVIVNTTPNNCTTVLCTPELFFENCDILSHWNWNASCTNCQADGSHGTEATYSANAVFWNNLGPGQVSHHLILTRFYLLFIIIINNIYYFILIVEDIQFSRLYSEVRCCSNKHLHGGERPTSIMRMHHVYSLSLLPNAIRLILPCLIA